MEQLILIAIIAIVSSLFGKSKNKEQQQMPPFDKNAKPQPPLFTNTEEQKTQRPTMKTQSFEDFAREILGGMQDEQPQKDIRPVEQDVEKQTPSYVAPPLKTERQSYGRLVAEKKDVQVTSINKTFELPTSKQALMQAVVMAEVLGPPKAKRK